MIRTPLPSLRAAAALALVASLAGSAGAQTWSDQFDQAGVTGRVFSTAVFEDQLVIGGYNSLQADNQSFGLVATWDGALWQPLGGGIAGGGAFTDFDVRDFAIYQGELVAAGTFTFAGGQPVKSIARFDGTDWQPLGAGLDLSFASTGSVYSLAVHQGLLYASGQFDLAGGAPASGFARWNGSSWQALGGFPAIAGGGPGYAWKMLVGPDGLLYLGGEFPSAGGVPGTGNVASWNGSSFASVGGGFLAFGSASVRDLAFYQGELWAVANYDLVAGGGNHEKAAVFDGTSWRAAGDFPDSSVGTRLDAIEVYDGDVYVGGNVVSVDGVSLRRMARWDGAAWSSPGGIFAQSINQFVFDMVAHDGKLWIGGEFSQVGYLPPGNEVVVSNSVGVFDGASWDNVGEGFGTDNGVQASALWNGGLVAIGPFSQAGSTVVGGMAFFDGGGWTALGSFGGGLPTAATEFEGDLVVVGDFTSVDGVPTPVPAARFDGAQWTALGSGALANAQEVEVYQGQVYALANFGLWRLSGGTWSQVGQQLFGFGQALQVHGGSLFVGGDYGLSAGHLYEWNGSTLSLVGGGTNDAVRALASFGGQLVLGGEFTSAGGTPARLLARWNGSSFAQVGNLTGTDVYSLASLGGDLYVGGNLVVPGNPPEKYIARLDGGQLAPLGSGMLGAPLTLEGDETTGTLWVGGSFLTTGGKLARNVGAWSTGAASSGLAYCTAGSSASGCQASLSASGLASASAGSGFVLSASGVEGQKDGLFFFGVNGRQAAPWGNGTSFQCVVPPVDRAGLLAGSGTLGLCDGAFAQDLNALWCASCPKPAKNPGAGATLQAQLWYRDPQSSSNQTTSLSDAWETIVQP